MRHRTLQLDNSNACFVGLLGKIPASARRLRSRRRPVVGLRADGTVRWGCRLGGHFPPLLVRTRSKPWGSHALPASPARQGSDASSPAATRS